MAKKKEPQNQGRSAQLQYCRLCLLLVSDQAIEQGIVMKTNVKPLLRFFFEVIMTDEVRRWLIPDGQSLKEGRWLRIVGWLMSEDVFLISKKTVMALFLNESAEMEMVATLDSTRMLLGKRLTSNRKQYFEKVLKQYLKTIK